MRGSANFAAQEGKHGIRSRMQRTGQSTSTGVPVAAPAKVFSRNGYVDLPLAAETHADPLIRQFTEEGGNFNTGNAYRVVHYAFAILLRRASPDHVFMCHPHPGESPFTLEIGECCSQQQHLRSWIVEVNILGNHFGICAVQNQLTGELKSVRVRPPVAEASRIRKYRGVDAGCDIGGDASAGCHSEFVDQSATAQASQSIQLISPKGCPLAW